MHTQAHFVLVHIPTYPKYFCICTFKHHTKKQDPGYPSMTNTQPVEMMVPETTATNVTAAYTAAVSAITTNSVAVISGCYSNYVFLLLRLGRLGSHSF